MREQRRFQRVELLASGWLFHNESKYNCRLKNISENGALISLKKTPVKSLGPGDRCSLMLCHADKDLQYPKIQAQIGRLEAEVVALEFTDSGTESHSMLEHLIQKELHFLGGGKKLLTLGREVAAQKGVGLTVLCFDNGELIPEREMHTLRLSTGKHSINVHLNRKEIEAFYGRNDSERTREKIYHAIERLNVR